MILQDMFDKYVEWKILNFFIENSTTSMYVNDTARKLRVSYGSVSTFVNAAIKDDLLIKKVIGNTHFYKLNNDQPEIGMFKIVSMLLKIKKLDIINKFLKNDDSIISITLYGSYANGTNYEKSDLYLLIIFNKKLNFQGVLQTAEGRLKKDINVQVFSVASWKKLITQDNIFYESVRKLHLVLYGSGLI